MKKILINKTGEQIRVALIDGDKLYDIEIEDCNKEQQANRICNGEIVSIEPSLGAAFINFGSSRNGFLPFKEIAHEYYSDKGKTKTERPNIKDVIFEGQKILVQVNREERGSKGAALSTYISLAGCYLVLMPNNPKSGGISRRIEGEEREKLHSVVNGLKTPDNMSVIVRTAGLGKSLEELQWDLDVLLNLWSSIKNISQSNDAPFFIHQESNISIRAIRDHLRPDITEIFIDDQEIYEEIKSYIERVKPDYINIVKLYSDPVPLFSRFQIEKQIESAFQRKVRLPAGGEIVIDHSEALTSIDVNSAQATKGGHIEETALNTNLEAAKEIAKQLRIRDLGGLIVIDFIDMERDENNRKVEDYLRELFKTDRARIQLTRISRLGLLEMSRQRLRSPLSKGSQELCPRCHGQGSIRNVKSLALTIRYLIEEKAAIEETKNILVRVPIDVATYLVNELRQNIVKIEQTHQTNITVLPCPHMNTPQYEIEAVNLKKYSNLPLSHEIVATPEIKSTHNFAPSKQPKQQPAIKTPLPDIQAPTAGKKEKSAGIFSRLLKRLFKKSEKETVSVKKEQETHTTRTYRKTSSPHTSKPKQPRGGYQRSRRNYRDKNETREQNKPIRTSGKPAPKRSRTSSSTHKKTTSPENSTPVVKKAVKEQVKKPVNERKNTHKEKTTASVVHEKPASPSPQKDFVQVETQRTSAPTVHAYPKNKEAIKETTNNNRQRQKPSPTPASSEDLVMVETQPSTVKEKNDS